MPTREDFKKDLELERMGAAVFISDVWKWAHFKLGQGYGFEVEVSGEQGNLATWQGVTLKLRPDTAPKVEAHAAE